MRASTRKPYPTPRRLPPRRTSAGTRLLCPPRAAPIPRLCHPRSIPNVVSPFASCDVGLIRTFVRHGRDPCEIPDEDRLARPSRGSKDSSPRTWKGQTLLLSFCNQFSSRARTARAANPMCARGWV